MNISSESYKRTYRCAVSNEHAEMFQSVMRAIVDDTNGCIALTSTQNGGVTIFRFTLEIPWGKVTDAAQVLVEHEGLAVVDYQIRDIGEEICLHGLGMSLPIARAA